MHSLFALKDLHSFKINSIIGEINISLKKSNSGTYLSMFDMSNSWQKEATKLLQDEITKEEYDNWRYSYPLEEVKRNKEARDAYRANNDTE